MLKNILILCFLTAAVTVAGWAQENVVEGDASQTEYTAYPQQNIIIPVEDLSKATILIDNRAVVIDGYWNFKDGEGRVMDEPEILSQPTTITDKLILAARGVGSTTVDVTIDGVTTRYTVSVLNRDPPPQQRSPAVKTVEETLAKLIDIPTVKVTVLDAASEFLAQQAADSLLNPSTDATDPNAATQTNSANATVQNSLPSFQPTVVLEGSVPDDLDLRRALSLARSFSPNVLNFIEVDNPLQVRIKIQVVSVTLGDEHTIGIQYRGSDDSVQGIRSEFTFDVVDFFNKFQFQRAGATPDISMFFNLIENASDIKILQEPTITVLNGQSGHFRVGGLFPVNRRTIDPSGAIVITTEYRPFGISLLVTPLAALPDVVPGNTHSYGDDDLVLGVPESGIPLETRGLQGNVISPTISKNGIIKMYVRPSISSLDFTRVDEDPVNQPDPIVNERLVETRVAMKHGESLVIGGLFDENFRNSVEKVPFLSEIPILGELFKNRNKDRERQELIFVLTPYVVGREEIEKGDQPKPRLSEMARYLSQNGVPPAVAKPTRISASDVNVRSAETRKPVVEPRQPEANVITLPPSPEPVQIREEIELSEDAEFIPLNEFEPVEPEAVAEEPLIEPEVITSTPPASPTPVQIETQVYSNEDLLVPDMETSILESDPFVQADVMVPDVEQISLPVEEEDDAFEGTEIMELPFPSADE